MKRFILKVSDKSGSMQGKQDDVQGGMATFMEEQAALNDDTFVSLVEFSSHDKIRTVYDLIPIAEVAPYRLRPGGDTALLDAIGSAVTDLKERIREMPEADRPDQVIVVISTDGEENDSREYKGADGLAQIRKLLTKLQRPFDEDADAGYRKAKAHKRGWKVFYLGAGEDAITAGNAMGVAAGHSLAYTNDGDGTKSSYGAVSRAVTRSGLGQDSAFTEAERAMTMTGDAKA